MSLGSNLPPKRMTLWSNQPGEWYLSHIRSLCYLREQLALFIEARMEPNTYGGSLLSLLHPVALYCPVHKKGKMRTEIFARAKVWQISSGLQFARSEFLTAAEKLELLCIRAWPRVQLPVMADASHLFFVMVSSSLATAWIFMISRGLEISFTENSRAYCGWERSTHMSDFVFEVSPELANCAGKAWSVTLRWQCTLPQNYNMHGSFTMPSNHTYIPGAF